MDSKTQKVIDAIAVTLQLHEIVWHATSKFIDIQFVEVLLWKFTREISGTRLKNGGFGWPGLTYYLWYCPDAAFLT